MYNERRIIRAVSSLFLRLFATSSCINCEVLAKKSLPQTDPLNAFLDDTPAEKFSIKTGKKTFNNFCSKCSPLHVECSFVKTTRIFFAQSPKKNSKVFKKVFWLELIPWKYFLKTRAKSYLCSKPD